MPYVQRHRLGFFYVIFIFIFWGECYSRILFDIEKKRGGEMEEQWMPRDNYICTYVGM